MIAGNTSRSKPAPEFAIARKLLARAPELACMCLDGRIILMNDIGLRLLNATPGGPRDPAGQPFSSLVHAGDSWSLDSWGNTKSENSGQLGTRRYCRIGTARTGYQYLQLTRAEHMVGDVRYEIIFGVNVAHIQENRNQFEDTRKELVHNGVILRRERTRRKWAERHVRKLAYEDQLTKLANRAHFQTKLETALRHAERSEKKTLLLFVDLDRFKDINDRLGHPAGDIILQEVARRLTASVRRTDTVARFGGDQFAIIANHISETKNVDTLAEKMLEALRAPFQVNGELIQVGCSVGVSIHPDNGKDSETLQKNAVLALQRAKTLGPGKYQIFDHAMSEQIRLRKQMERELTHAIQADELVTYYQPQVEITTGKVRGIEALVRWDHPTRGLVPPVEFVPAAESLGLIVPLTQWVLRSACRDLKHCHTRGLMIDHVSVNLSASLLRDTDLLNVVQRTLEQTQLAPEYLEVEITESMMMEDVSTAGKFLRELSGLGVGVSLDDFGTGYSSLTHLRQFPLTSLKIDRSFIMEMSAKPEDIAIVRAVVSLAHSLGLRVIAEGVEDGEQLDILRTEDCDDVQGYYHSAPLPLGELIDWCANREARSDTKNMEFAARA